MNDAPEPRKPPAKAPRSGKPIRVSRIFGYGLLIFGILSIIDFFSPIPIPSAGGSAILSGLFFSYAIMAFGEKHLSMFDLNNSREYQGSKLTADLQEEMSRSEAG